ncbi:MAG: hypothetical protein IKS48_10395 [Eubacterium sp.]|nr:hypothetical protein [Eubacterium sp.]
MSFEVKETTGEVLMTGTFVDVYEFAERWSKFSTFQKAVLRSCSYVGTIDDFGLHCDYSAPVGMIYRKQLIELQELGLIQIISFDEKTYELYKNQLDYYDFEKNRGKKYSKNIKIFLIPYPAELANIILELDSDRFPDHSGVGPMKRKNIDRREIANAKRKELHKQNRK